MTESELCLALLKCDSEEEVVALLTEAGYWLDRDAWRYFADQENNWSTIGNQQSSPHAALVEKLVNAVDATLMGHCYDAGLDPTSNEAPQTMRAAVAQFFDNTTLEKSPSAGLIRNWTSGQRTQVAQSITLVATGLKSRPCFTIADAGEGQTPDDMPDTLLSLARTNKMRIPFVQGKHNMGGTGVFKFCGKQNLQFVVTRRHPKALKSYNRDSQLWGFTVVRREDPERGRRSSVFTYLAPLGKDVHPGKGGVLRFNEEINPSTYAAKATELRDREAKLKLQLDACDIGRHENADIAVKAFELSQNLRAKWLTADYAVKRRYLEIVFLNFVLDDVTLVPETRKPFDMLAEGLLVSSSRGDRTPIELFLAGVASWEPYVERLIIAA